MQFSQIFFFSKNEEYFYRAQVDFDFGQVHIVWWLSYGQVEEKISVEPCSVSQGIISSDIDKVYQSLAVPNTVYCDHWNADPWLNSRHITES